MDYFHFVGRNVTKAYSDRIVPFYRWHSCVCIHAAVMVFVVFVCLPFVHLSV